MLGLVVHREPHAHAELGIIFKQGVAPCRPAVLSIGGPGRGGQVAAVDARTAGRVGDDRPVAEDLNSSA